MSADHSPLIAALEETERTVLKHGSRGLNRQRLSRLLREAAAALAEPVVEREALRRKIINTVDPLWTGHEVKQAVLDLLSAEPVVEPTGRDRHETGDCDCFAAAGYPLAADAGWAAARWVVANYLTVYADSPTPPEPTEALRVGENPLADRLIAKNERIRNERNALLYENDRLRVATPSTPAPTDAQVEAAARAISRVAFKDQVDWDECVDEARAALLAASEEVPGPGASASRTPPRPACLALCHRDLPTDLPN